MTTNNCTSCVFAHREGKALYCRRNPPITVLGPVQTVAGPQLAWQTSFPLVREEWWCGAFANFSAQMLGERNSNRPNDTPAN